MLWLGERDIAKCLNEIDLIQSMKRGFRQLDNDAVQSKRIRVDLSLIPEAQADAQAMILVPGTVRAIPAYTVKVNAKYPDNPIVGLPSIQGLIQLFESKTGTPLAILDSPMITGHRTAAAAAVAADTLAKKNASTVAIIGAGYQGEIQLRYLRHVRNVDTVYVYDVRESAAMGYAQRWVQEGITCHVVSSVEDAVKHADVIICTTWSREPFIWLHMLNPGVHITTLGPDTEGKVEISEEVILQSRFVCDNYQMALSMGALNTFKPDLRLKSVSTLTDVLNAKAEGRQTDEDITVFGAVGLPFQDLIAAWAIYRAAIADGIGVWLD